MKGLATSSVSVWQRHPDGRLLSKEPLVALANQDVMIEVEVEGVSMRVYVSEGVLQTETTAAK